MNKLLSLAALATVAAASNANAQGFFDPPSKPFNLYSTFSNDGYNTSRGVLFNVSTPYSAKEYCWTNDMAQGEKLVWELWENGNLVDQQSTAASGGFQDYTSPTNGYVMTPGNTYELSVSFQGNANGNYFYAYDPAFFGDPPFNVGVFTVFDGTQNHDASNFVMPRMGIDCIIPTPGSAAVLGLAGLAAARRRR